MKCDIKIHNFVLKPKIQKENAFEIKEKLNFITDTSKVGISRENNDPDLFYKFKQTKKNQKILYLFRIGAAQPQPRENVIAPSFQRVFFCFVFHF